MSTGLYSKAGTIPVQDGCFAFMFTNVGDTTAYVNGMVVYPSSTPTTALGDSRSISAHVTDLYMGNINLRFSGAGTNPQIEIVQLFYITSNAY